MIDLVIWPGWLAGIAIGALMVGLLWTTNRQLGVSTAYGGPCRLLPRGEVFRHGAFGRSNHWRLWFALGIPVGGALGVISSPEASWEPTASMGTLYDAVMPESLPLKGMVLMAAGVLMGFGARMAGGCTSGHVISGVSLLNPVSLLAGGLFFVGGLLAVQLLFLGGGQ